MLFFLPPKDGYCFLPTWYDRISYQLEQRNGHGKDRNYT
jgi:hypothetical protein